jgi:predicted amidophosphoribosyltransferase
MRLPTDLRSVRCEFCSYNFEPSLDRCPHCGRPSLFPNVTDADQPEERNAIQQRYQEAYADASRRGTQVVSRAFEQAVATQSQAVIARHIEEVGRLAFRDNEIYASFYEVVEAGVRTPSGGA